MTRYTNENYGRHLSRSHSRRKVRHSRKRRFSVAGLLLLACLVICVAALGSALEGIMPDAFAAGSRRPVSDTVHLSADTHDELSVPLVQEETAAADPQPSYDYSQPVPQSTAVDDSYFNDAVFIGDSRTQGLITATGLYNATAFTHQGLTVDTAFKDLIVEIDGQYYTAIDALSRTQFNKVYIMLGINETGWIYSSKFIEGYGRIIDAVKAANPEAQIYVQEILPVSNSVSNSHDYIKNSKIDEYNQLLQQLADEKQVYFVDTASAVAGADGSLPEDAAVDGIHLKNSYCQQWLDYLKTHTVN